MLDCEHKASMCQCINWKKDDMDVLAHHWIINFEFTGFELEYTTLEPEEGRRLCKVGRCRICGKRLCIGENLPAQATANDLLTEIFRRTFQMWDADRECLPDDADCFEELFLSLFHESHQEFVGEWMARHGRSIGEGS